MMFWALARLSFSAAKIVSCNNKNNVMVYLQNYFNFIHKLCFLRGLRMWSAGLACAVYSSISCRRHKKAWVLTVDLRLNIQG
jgi:hypothetical protein